ncbi:unnamed protein product [Caenorhabditis brenneri]
MQRVLRKLNCLLNQECSLKLGLVNMPDVVMKQILGELDFRTILLLRNVSHDFRSFIDTKPAGPRVTMIFILVQSHAITFEIYTKSRFSRGPTQRVPIEYRKEDIGCMVTCTYRRANIQKFLKFEDFVNIALKDLKVFINRQKCHLAVFQLDFDNTQRKFFGKIGNIKEITERFLISTEEMLKSRKQPLEVEDLCMSVTAQEQVLKVLPYFDSKYIRKITIHGNNHPNTMDPLEFDKLEKLDQWKNAIDMNIWRYDIKTTPLESFLQFSRVDLFLFEVNAEKLIKLKNAISLSSKVETFSIKYKILDGEDLLVKSLGQHSSSTDRYGITESLWTFNFSNSSDMLSVSFLSSGTISFRRVKPSDIKS